MINSSLGVYKAARSLGADTVRHGDGIEGLLKEELLEFQRPADDRMSIELLKRTPSSYLGSCCFSCLTRTPMPPRSSSCSPCLTSTTSVPCLYIGGND